MTNEEIELIKKTLKIAMVYDPLCQDKNEMPSIELWTEAMEKFHKQNPAGPNHTKENDTTVNMICAATFLLIAKSVLEHFEKNK